jgi:hypothetical protein
VISISRRAPVPGTRTIAVAAGIAVVAALTGAASWPTDAEAAAPRRAAYCGACHKPIRLDWEQSAHGTSWSNPVFRAFLEEAKATLGGDIQRQCIACHAPAAHVAGDVAVADPISQEGIGCKSSHNLSAVDPATKPASYTHDPSDPNLIRGPYRDADPRGAHGAAYSEIHTKSAFCASCHSAAHPRSGVLIEATYLDWTTSKASAAGKRCQDCHMPSAAGKAAVSASKSRPSVSAHTFVGPRSTPAWLDSAATLAAAASGGRLRLEVVNRIAGHALPGGGNSMRTIALDVVFRDAKGAEISRLVAERFGTEFSAADGSFPAYKWNAHGVARATSIPADSSRVVWCDLPPGAASAEAALTYYAVHPAYRPMLAARGVDLSGREPYVMARAKVPLR